MHENKQLKMNVGNFKQWSTEELVSWIVQLDPEHYAQYADEMLRVMTEEDVDGMCLDGDVSIDDLKRWGIRRFKHSKHILKAIMGLFLENGAPGGQRWQRLYKCKSCRVARYCSRKCQKIDWPKHKQLCKTVK